MKLYFITSNRAKLANAKHICKDYDIAIVPHKKLFYGYGYKEPHIQLREQLLQSSIENAIHRWEKYVHGRANDSFFFIEDTSVKISALSSGSEEVPGVDVKYWMEDMTFEKLDAQLKEKGNDRSARVMSHVILYIPFQIRKQIGIDKEYILFTSHTDGMISVKEYEIQTNILYPWLDNKTFNKWFIPEGECLPMSLLDISRADRCDFRRGAFEQMIQFLQDNNLLKHNGGEINMISPKLFSKRLLFCGETCAGKSTAGRYLLEKYGIYHIEASDFMGVIYHETCGKDTTINRHDFASRLLQAEPTIVAEQVVQYIMSKGLEDNFVVTGFRNNAEIDYFVKNFAILDKYSFYIESREDVRYDRWERRQRDPHGIYSLEEFARINDVQSGMGVREIRNRRGIQIIKNNYKKHKSYYDALDNVVSDIDTEYEKNVEERIQYFQDTKQLSLEKCILLTLALEYLKDENTYLTTAQIAKKINAIFPVLEKKKNKNNVSRYFNMSLYPFYELSTKEEKIVYKLSPLGYSEALLMLKHLEKRE